MAVQYIPMNPSTPQPNPPVRRSTRHLALPPTPSSLSSRPRQSLATTSPSSLSNSHSRKRSRFQDEQDQKEQDLPVESFPQTPSPRTRLGTIIDNRVPITPEPTPRAIRAQKRRKLTDNAAETETDPATPSDLSSSDLSSSSSSPSFSPSHSLSPTTPHPQPISPEPISPLHSHSSSPYIVKSKSTSRLRKRKLEDDGASSVASDTPTPPSIGDPLPRSLTKRRKLDRSTPSRRKPPRSLRVRSKSKLSISSGTPPTPLTSSKKRTSPNLRPSRARSSGSVLLPRVGGNDTRAKNVRRSARLLVHTGDESQCPDELSPLSPLTPPPSDDDAESSQLTESANGQHADFPSSDTPARFLAEEEDDTEMEMIACIGGVTPPASWRSIIPSHISNPVLKGRPPPNPTLYAELQLASYRRTKPNTPSPLSLYSYTGVTPPTSPALSAATINSLDAIDDIPPLGEVAAVGAITGDTALVGLPEQLFHEQQQPQMQFYGQGYSQVESPQPGQVFEQPLHQPQSELRPSANVAVASSASSPESSNPSPPALDMNFMMIDLQLHMQFQHMDMPGSASEGMNFGVDQIGFMMGGNAAEERNDRIPTTVHMQDVHLQQQPHHEHQNQNHQQIMDVQPNHQLFGYPYFSDQQGQMQQGSNQLYATQEFGGGSQSFQVQPEFQQRHQAQRQFQDQQQPNYPHQHREQPQASSSSNFETYDGIQPYQSVPPQVYERPHQQAQQDFQAQQQQQDGGDETRPFSGSTLNVGYDAGAYQTETQTSPSTSVATPTTSTIAVAAPPVRTATTPISHYTLSMHNALHFFQQSHSRFHEDQALLAHDAVEMHTRQLEEFQREKEERKRRLKRTKLVREVHVVPMGSSAAGLGLSALGIGVGTGCGVGRARGLWAVACKARMFEVVRIYTPALIREVTEISAREYYRRMGLKYPTCRFALSLFRRRMRRREDDGSISEDDPLVDRDRDHEQEGCDAEGDGDDVFDGLSGLEKKDDGDADGEEFRKEQIFDFELLDDDEEYEEAEEVMEDVRKQGDVVDVDFDEEMDDDDDDDEEEEDEDEDGDDGDGDELESGTDLDLEAIRDPFFQPELSMRITPQELIPSISGGSETTFYVPPPEVYAVHEPNTAQCEEPALDADSEAQASSTLASTTTKVTLKQNQKQKYMLFHRPVLPLPPPALSTFRPAALKFYNVDPVHAGRGTPCVKERREVWAGLPKVSISVKQTTRRIGDSDGGLSSSGIAWYADVDGTAKNGTLKATGSDARSVHVSAEKDDSVFGDCAGTCCMDEDAKGKGKMKGEGEGEKADVGEEKLEDELPRGEEEAHGEDDGPSTALTQPIAQPQPPQPTRHMTVEIPPAHSDRIPHRRRGVLGRTELLKVYAPPPKLVPSILPLARRPPRPPPPPSLGLGIGLDEAETAVRTLAAQQAYHYPVVPYSWEQVAEAMEVLAYQGIDASVWVDGRGQSPTPSSPLSTSSNGISGTEVQIQPTFNPSSSELSAALG